ncbi:phage tail protein [Streptomyces sp. CB02959]|uniref:phage distal tail protein n=1 Tax=Streptomyces sp. CB02959 TaxID=2020330 RepID=UPI000C2742DA|nr:phage tail protein [Streptomyces sp. CB02959]PJN38061.1 phage tail protein [Streptomyces sp. CB02959]
MPQLLNAAGDQVTQDGQIEFAGLLMGETTEYVGEQLTGWDDLPDVESATVLRPTQHGGWPGHLLAGTRTLQFDFMVLPDSMERYPTLLADLRRATAPTQREQDLVVQLAGARRLMRGRVTRRALPADRRYTRGEPYGSVVWECSDPRRYELQENRITCGLPAPEPGLDWTDGLDHPLEWGITGSTGTLAAPNLGEAPTHPVVEFRGPVVRPSLLQLHTGWRLEYDITLTESDVLRIDCDEGTAVLNGTASRLYTVTASSVPEQTFTFDPGVSVLAFRAAPGFYDPLASVTVRWRSAFW